MKKQFFTITFIFISLFVFCNKSFSQTAPGGAGTGVIVPGEGTCPVSYSFKRNNGNGWGVCHGDAQVRVAFNPFPAEDNIPTLTAIYYKGEALTNIVLPVSGDIIDKTQPYISYCLTGSLPAKDNGNPKANIPPASKLILEFTYPSGLVCRTDNEIPN